MVPQDSSKQHATCEAYTSSIPYVVWRELLRETLGFGRDSPGADIVERIRAEVASKAPDLAPWLPLLAAVIDVEMDATPEVLQLAESNRRAKLHETVARFLEAVVPDKLLLEIDDAHHMDEASAELLAHLTGGLASRSWLVAVGRRASGSGFEAREAPEVVRIELKPLAPQDALRLAQLAAEKTPLPAHALEVVANRSGGNPQFLRDLVRSAIESGGVADLPESAEAATMTQIDTLPPDDRALVRRVAVFGHTFHPRMVSWLYNEEDGPAPDATALNRLGGLFDEEPDGYLRFRQTLLRDSAYQGLPFKLRRQLHSSVAAHIEEEMDFPEEAGAMLSLHYFEAGEFPPAWRYATAAAKRAEDVYAYVEAAGLYARALEAGGKIPDLPKFEIGRTHEALGDAWYKAGVYSKALDAYMASQELIAGEPLLEADLLLKLSHAEGRLGKYAEALRLADASRSRVLGLSGAEAARHVARASARCAKVLQLEGRTAEAVESAERAEKEAETADDPEALGDAYFVMGDAYGALSKEGARALFQRSLEAYQRAGNLESQAALLSDLGVVCQWEGSWDEALSYYEQGRDAALKIGSTVTAALARINVAEILIDRGEWAEAEGFLMGTLPFWKASQFRFFLAGCSMFLDASLRSGASMKRWVALRKQDKLRAGRSAESTPVRRCPNRGMPPGERRSGGSAGAGERHVEPRQRLERRGPAGAAAPSNPGPRAAGAERSMGRAGRAGGKPRGSEGAAQPLRGRSDDALADRARSPGRYRAAARDGGREPLRPFGLQGPRGTARAAPQSRSGNVKRPRGAAPCVTGLIPDYGCLTKPSLWSITFVQNCTRPLPTGVHPTWAMHIFAAVPGG